MDEIYSVSPWYSLINHAVESLSKHTKVNYALTYALKTTIDILVFVILCKIQWASEYQTTRFTWMPDFVVWDRNGLPSHASCPKTNLAYIFIFCCVSTWKLWTFQTPAKSGIDPHCIIGFEFSQFCELIYLIGHETELILGLSIMIWKGLGSHPGLVHLRGQKRRTGKGLEVTWKNVIGAKPSREKKQKTKTKNKILNLVPLWQILFLDVPREVSVQGKATILYVQLSTNSRLSC